MATQLQRADVSDVINENISRKRKADVVPNGAGEKFCLRKNIPRYSGGLHVEKCSNLFSYALWAFHFIWEFISGNLR